MEIQWGAFLYIYLTQEMTALKKNSDSLFHLVSLSSENLKMKVESCSFYSILLEMSKWHFQDNGSLFQTLPKTLKFKYFQIEFVKCCMKYTNLNKHNQLCFVVLETKNECMHFKWLCCHSSCLMNEV